jgi:DNA mismatch repair protein MutL
MDVPMPKIQKLPIHEAQKIAAGEVVERPANVVKELLENAIDANATKISIFIEEGGKKLIRVVDNGCGMGLEDAYLCFEHHATSKITCVNDLALITTFGFRGEALSSIASVSSIELITKEEDALEGIKLSLEAGVVQEYIAISTNAGTDISIHNLFYNIPARKKFLKADDTELRHIQQLFYASVLSHCHIHFKFIVDGREIFNCPPTVTLHERAQQIWEPAMTQNMVALQTHDRSPIHGLISNHHYSRYDRNSVYFFVNLRWVKHQKLVSSLLKGYLNVLPPGRFPAGVIFITLDQEQLDVNIHPRKEEVQFLHPRIIEQELQKMVKKTLEENLSLQLKKSVTFSPAFEIMTASRPDALQFTPMRFSQVNSPSPKTALEFPQDLSLVHIKVLDEDPFDVSSFEAEASELGQAVFEQKGLEDISLQVEKAAVQLPIQENFTIIGQFNKTYILLEQDDGLVIIDQHAAHERILYELFSKRFESVATVKLLFPQVIPLNEEKIKILEPYLELMRSHGIGIEVWSQTELMIQSTPVHLKNQSLQDLVTHMLDWISTYEDLDKEQFFKVVNEKIHAQMACKAAVKAGDSLSSEQIHQLINDLYATPHRFSCPHGRPTCWNLTTYEIEKKFKRKQ